MSFAREISSVLPSSKFMYESLLQVSFAIKNKVTWQLWSFSCNVNASKLEVMEELLLVWFNSGKLSSNSWNFIASALSIASVIISWTCTLTLPAAKPRYLCFASSWYVWEWFPELGWTILVCAWNWWRDGLSFILSPLLPNVHPSMPSRESTNNVTLMYKQDF